MKLGVALFLFTAILASCKSAPLSETGFLSDYAMLEPTEEGMRYLDTEVLANYQRFLIEPVEVFFHDPNSMSDSDRQELERLAAYFDGAIRAAVADAYELVDLPEPGVARLRVALTDIEPSMPVMAALPPERTAGLRLGGATMEAEILDSMTGMQFGAVVDSEDSHGLSLASSGARFGAESTLEAWAARFRRRLDEVNGR